MKWVDLGCGKGATSVFLAREYGAEVVATEWWVETDEVTAVFADAGDSQVTTTVRAEAHTQWEITELVTVTSARLQQHGWQDWLLWEQAVAEHAGDRAGLPSSQAVIDLLTADGGDLLSFAMVTARKN